METPQLIRKGIVLLSNAQKAEDSGCEDMARRELIELRRLLSKELREPKKP